MGKFITVTPMRRVFFGNGDFRWVQGASLMLNTRYIVTIQIMSNNLSQISMKDGSNYIVPSSQITGVTE